MNHLDYPTFQLRESHLDALRFGIRVGKVELSDAAQPSAALAQARNLGLQLIIARCDTRSLKVAQALETTGFRLMDTLVYYSQRFDLRRKALLPSGYRWRLANRSDAFAVEALARESFNGYLGHYHADERLARDACDDVYADWAARSCVDQQVSDAVVLVERTSDDGTPSLAAFATHARVDDATWEGVLYGVSPAHQGRGLYGELIALGGEVGVERNHSRMLVSTQITNLSVQKSWCKQGFLPIRSSYTFHAWLDKVITT